MLKIISKISGVFLRKKEVPYVWLSIFMILMLLSCDNPHTYIISKQDSLLKASHTDSLGIVIMSPKVKYAMYTFVIDSSNHVFFYAMPENEQHEGIYDKPEPVSLHLMSNHVFVVPKGTEKVFFEENVLKKKSQRMIKTIMLASFKDTVTVRFLKYLKAISDDKNNKISLNIRLALPEERTVIANKMSLTYGDDHSKTNAN